MNELELELIEQAEARARADLAAALNDNRVTRAIRARPIIATGIGFAAGCAAGALVGSERGRALARPLLAAGRIALSGAALGPTLAE